MPSLMRTLALAWGRGILEVLLFFPALFLLSPLPGLDAIFPYWIAALTLYMPLGALTRMVLDTEFRVLFILAGALLVGGISWLAFGVGFAALGAALAGGVLYYHGFRSIRTAWHILFPVGLYWICLFIYMIAALILPRLSVYGSTASPLGWLGALSLVLTLFISNSSNLKEETHSGQNEVRLAQGVVWKNRLLITLVLAVIMAIGLFSPIKRLFIRLKNWLLEQINAWLQWMNRPGEDTQSVQSTPPPGNMGMPGEKGEPAAWAVILEKIAYYIGVVLLVALVLGILYVFVKVAYRQIKKLIAWLRERAENQSVGMQEYEEEKTNLLDWSELRKQLGERVSSFVSRFERDPNWDRLSSAERIRHLYRSFVRRSVGAGQPFEAHLTAQEQLSVRQDRQLNEKQRNELSDAYNAVRYGSKQVEEDVANRLKRDSGL
jgi:hypothetical protein